MPNSYLFTEPILKQYGDYTFETNSGLVYEVRFVRKCNDIFHVTMAFGVENQENMDLYSSTNAGEPFKIISTVIAIVNDYLSKNPYVRKIEFTGISEDTLQVIERESIRTRWYKRCLRYFNNWKLIQNSNHLLVIKEI